MNTDKKKRKKKKEKEKYFLKLMNTAVLRKPMGNVRK